MLTYHGRLALAAATALLVVVGCGDGKGGADASDPPPLAKADFIAKANKICDDQISDFQKGLVAFGKKHREEADKRSPTALLEETADDVLVPIFEKRIEAIAAFGVPRGDEAQIDAYLDALREGVAEMGELSPSKFTDFEDPLRPAARLAREYGLSECG